MMKKMIYVALLLACFSCKGESKKTAQEETGPATAGEKVTMQNGLPVIDLQKEYPKVHLNLQDIADVEYIPLETNKDALLQGLHNFCMDENTLITTTFKTGEIMLFDRKGKHLKTFNHQGQGAKEYRTVYCALTADFQKKEIFVLDWRPGVSSSIKVYSFDGLYLRTLPLPVDWEIAMYDFDKEHLLIEDYGQVDLKYQPKYVNLTPYRLLSKQTGEMKELPITLKERMRNTLRDRLVIPGKGVMSFILDFHAKPVAVNDDKALITDFTSDTIYTYQKGKLKPLALKANRLTEHGSTIIVGANGWSDRYLLLTTQDRRALTEINLNTQSPEQLQNIQSPDSHLLLFDRETETIREVILHDANMVTDPEKSLTPELSDYELLPNSAILNYNAERLMEKHEKGELKGELAKLAPTLQFDDNPVLVLVKFKE